MKMTLKEYRHKRRYYLNKISRRTHHSRRKRDVARAVESWQTRLARLRDVYYGRADGLIDRNYDPDIPRIGDWNLRRRFEILSRDNFTCRYCGRSAPDVVLQVDHIHPASKGGTNHPTNLVTACKECNIGKSDLLIRLSV